MPKLITVYWRDIPSQVIAKKGRTTSKVQLSQRFQEAIDRAAMRAGKGSSDAYLSEWRREASTCGDDLESAAKELAHVLEQRYNDDDLLALIRAKGVKTDPTSLRPRLDVRCPKMVSAPRTSAKICLSGSRARVE